MPDPWNPLAHAVVVDQAGVLFVDPLAGLIETPLPAAAVAVASAAAFWPAGAAVEHPAPSSIPPTAAPAAPSRSGVRPNRPARSDSSLEAFIGNTFHGRFIPALPRVADAPGTGPVAGCSNPYP